jgi:hypothetical protein
MVIGGGFDGYGYQKIDPKFKLPPDEVPHAETLIIADPGIKRGFTGIPAEFMERYGAAGGGRLPFKPMDYLRDSLIASYTALDMLREADVELLLSVFASDPIVEDNTVTGLYFEGKGGRQAVRSKVVIDATGEADVSRRAGAEALYPKESYNRMDKHSPTSMGIWAVIGGIDVDRYYEYLRTVDQPYQIEIREIEGLGKITVYGSGRFPHGKVLNEKERQAGIRAQLLRPHQYVDASNPVHISRMEEEIRKYLFEVAAELRKNVPGYEGAYLMTVSPYLTVRGGPCIKGAYTLTMDDCLAGKRFDDVVYVYGEPRALHRTRQKHGKALWTDMPFRVMLPEKLDGLIAVGRCASGIPDTLLRNRMAVMHMGQVGGTAAALSVKTGVQPRGLNVKSLQANLVDEGFHLGSLARLNELGLPHFSAEKNVVEGATD